MNKQLWIIVGGNGAGKSTFYDRFLKTTGLSFVNADAIAKDLNKKISPKVSKKAQDQAWENCQDKLRRGETFCFETVFSHTSKVELIVQAKELGYTVNLVFIHLNEVALNLARVTQRVSSGGHNVPHGKIKTRIPRTLENVSKVIHIVDQAKLLDNSSGTDPFKTIATIKNGQLLDRVQPLPDWARDILKNLKQ